MFFLKSILYFTNFFFWFSFVVFVVAFFFLFFIAMHLLINIFSLTLCLTLASITDFLVSGEYDKRGYTN